MLINEIIDAYNQNPRQNLILVNRTKKDNLDEGTRCSHVNWLGKGCSLVIGIEGQPAIWLTIHKKIREDWNRVQDSVLKALDDAGYPCVMTQNSQDEIFCVNFFDYGNNPLAWADAVKGMADVLEDWVHQLVIDPNYVPTISGYRVAREPEVIAAVKAQMNKRGFKTYGNAKSAREHMEQTVKNLMTLELSMADLQPYIDQI